MSRIRRLLPLIIICFVFCAVLVITAVFPQIDYSVSAALTSLPVSYPVGNFLEIWIEPVPLLPMCFVIAMLVVCLFRTKEKKVLMRVIGSGALVGGVVLGEQVVFRIVQYYCKLDDITKPWIDLDTPVVSDQIWVTAVCTLAGAVIMFICVLAATKIKQNILKKTERVLAVCVIVLMAELSIVSGLKHLWGRMRYRYWAQTDNGFFPWYTFNGSPENDNFKSFPSGHTANSMLLLPMTFIFDALGREKAGRILRGCHIVWMIVVMTSRIMAGAHFLSDVCGGALVSIFIVTVTAALTFKDGKMSGGDISDTVEI